MYFLEVASGALISGEGAYTLELYSATPPSALADNAAWDLPAVDRDSHIASISLGTPVDKGSTLKIEQDISPPRLIVVPAGNTLYGYLVTVGGFVATAAARRVTLTTVAA